jgi:hypothetical protein
LETPLMMRLPVRSGWQLRVIALRFGNHRLRVKESVARASSARYHHSIN